MPRRKFQFSLLTLFVTLTLCAVGLGVWFSRPTKVTFMPGKSSSLSVPWPQTHSAYDFIQYKVLIESPRGNRRHWVGLLTISPPEERDTSGLVHLSLSADTGEIQWITMPQAKDMLVEPPDQDELTYAYNALANTLTYNKTTLDCPPGSVIVIQYDSDHQPDITVDDGQFQNLDLQPNALTTLRNLYSTWQREFEDRYH